MYRIVLSVMAWWLSWLERRPVTAEVVGSNPIRVVCMILSYGNYIYYGILAQLGEHLPYKQRVIGSSPIGPICRSGGTGRRPGLKIPWVVIPVPVRFRSAAWPETLDFQGFFWCLDIFTPFWNTSYLTPKWILTSDLTADTKYLSSFKIIFWYNIHFFYSWKLEFPCLIVSKVALSKIKVK